MRPLGAYRVHSDSASARHHAKMKMLTRFVEKRAVARLEGRTYQQIAAAGGGIQATMKSVRQASPEELKEQARRRLRALLCHGATTIEVKSGYGLSLEDELKCLRVIEYQDCSL